MEIKSTLLNDQEFEWVKNSILNVDSIDGEGPFRVKLVEYINDTADNDDDKFFFDMLPFVRFLDPSNQSIAFTDPNRLIYLNAPGNIIGKNFKQWDFTFDHECLHQLWDTFGVADKIKESGLEYNHYILNIASDCVINDYLVKWRKKEQPDGTITPDYIKQNFGVEYDNKVDTQYTLYCKMIEKKDEIMNDPLCQKINGKIKPKEVRKQSGPTPPPPPQGKHDPDFIKGWTDAITDVVDKKVDPTDENLKPKNTGNDEYDDGYNSAIDNMKDGLENGIDIGDNNSGGGSSSQSDLPQIPWETDNKSADGGGEGSSDKGESDDNSGGCKSDDNKSPEEKANDSAKAAQDAADAANDAADAAQDVADAAGSAGDQSASDMQDAADEARDAADKAQAAADEAKDAADKAKKAAKKGDGDAAEDAAEEAADAAREAAKAARDAADAARKAGKDGSDSDDKNTKKAGEEAKDAADAADKAADNAENAADGKESNDDASKGSENQKPSNGIGQGHVAPTESEEDLEKIKKMVEDVVKDHSNRIVGDLADFISKCKSSAKMHNAGLDVKVTKGVSGWNVSLDKCINKYVKQKVFQKKRQYQSTYSRIKRGVGYVKQGEPLQPGRRVKDDTMLLNAAFYIDRSGSMGSSLGTVFDACYKICESLKKKYHKEKIIDDIVFKIFAFDDDVVPVKYGKKTSLGGGTCSMDDLLKEITKNSNDYLANIVITDGYFNIDKSKINSFLNEINGIVIYIVNRDFPEMQELAGKYSTKLFFIRADENFELD